MVLHKLAANVASILGTVSLLMTLGISPSIQSEGSAAFLTRGTMIVFVTSKDGLIVAADSEQTISRDPNCKYSVDKIVELRSHTRSVITIAGVDTIYDPTNEPKIVDPCIYANSHDPVARFSDTAQTFLDSYQGKIDVEVFKHLQTAMLEKVVSLKKKYGDVLSNREGVFMLSYAHYSPNEKTATYAAFRICLSAPSENPSVCSSEWTVMGQTDVAVLKIVGATDCFDKLVRSPGGRSSFAGTFLKDFDDFISHPRPISEITSAEALAVAVDVIKSTSKLSSTLPAAICGVGEPIHAVILDEHQRPFTLQ